MTVCVFISPFSAFSSCAAARWAAKAAGWGRVLSIPA